MLKALHYDQLIEKYRRLPTTVVFGEWQSYMSPQRTNMATLCYYYQEEGHFKAKCTKVSD